LTPELRAEYSRLRDEALARQKLEPAGEITSAKLSRELIDGQVIEQTNTAIWEASSMEDLVIVDSFPLPTHYAHGLAWDGHVIWVSEAFATDLWEINPSNGSIINRYTNPVVDARDLAFDGTNLWVVQWSSGPPYHIYKLDASLLVELTLEVATSSAPEGLTWADGFLWLTTHDGPIYKVDPADGSIISTIGSIAAGEPHGAAWDGEHLWIGMQLTAKIHEITTGGSILETYDSPVGPMQQGLTWDGTYLWATGGTNILYKLQVDGPPPPPPAVTWDVYFGTDPLALELIAECNGVCDRNCDPTPGPGETLDECTTYYWRVIAKNACGETEGPVWSFTTEGVCNRDPNCSDAIPSVAEVWPPNHKWVEIEILDVNDPDGDEVSITITGITQDEPVFGKGSGRTGPDGDGIGTSIARVRAERSGKGNGRVYEISFDAEDGMGGMCSGTVSVCVPHDQSPSDGEPGQQCIDDGQLYDSTASEVRRVDLNNDGVINQLDFAILTNYWLASYELDD
jgi:hypothetical protein